MTHDGRRSTDDNARWSQHEREHDTADAVHRREHEAEQRSLTLAAQQIERRLEDLNELRAEVLKDRAAFIQVDTYRAEHSALKAELLGQIEKVRAIAERIGDSLDTVQKSVDRAEGAVNTWRWIAGFLGIGGVALIIYSLATFGHP